MSPSQQRLSWQHRSKTLAASALVVVASLFAPVGGEPAALAAPTDSPYTSAVLADKPSFYWPLNDASGPAAAAAGKATLRPTGNVTFGVDGVDQAVSLDGRNGYLETPSQSAFDARGTSPFSVEFWVSLRSAAPSGQYSRLVAREANGEGWSIQLQPGTTQLRFVRHGGGGSDYLGWDDRVALPANQLSHVAATYDGKTMRLYVNGVEKAAMASTRALSAVTQPLTVGRASFYNGQFLNGIVDEVAFYPSALSASAVTRHYAAARAPQAPAPTPTAAPATPVPATPTPKPSPTATTPPPTPTATVPAPTPTATVPTPTPTAAPARPAASPYANTVLADKPSFYWPMDDTSGPVASPAAGGASLAASGGATFGGSDLTGVSLDGRGGFLQAPNQSAFDARGTSPFSVEFWVALRASVPSGQYSRIVAHEANGEGWSIQLQPGTTQLRFVRHSGGGSDYLGWDDRVALPLGQPAHVVATYDGGTMRLYVNGVEKAAIASTRALSTVAQPLTVGRASFYNGQFLNGSVGQVAFYTTALSGSAVAQHYQAASGDQSAAPAPTQPDQTTPAQPTPTATPSPTPAAPTPTPTVPAPTPTAAPACATSLQTIVDQAGSGSTVTVPGCLFRETVRISKPLTLVAQPNAEIRGSDVWTDWQSQSGLWVSTQRVPDLPFGASPFSDVVKDPRAAWPEQVFLNGVELDQVDSTATPKAGQFKIVNRSSDRRVVLGENPAGKTVEVTVRTAWLVVQASDVTVRGASASAPFTMRHAGSNYQHGGVEVYGQNRFVLENADVSYAHTANVAVYHGVNHRLSRVNSHHAGNVGIDIGANFSGPAVSGFIVEDSELAYNNTQGFNPGWHAGGLKATVRSDAVYRRNHVHHNYGAGLWVDTRANNNEFSGNNLHHNDGPGIFFEVSDGARIFDNAVWENNRLSQSWGWDAGILISSSKNAEVYNNVVAWNGDGISVISQSRGDQPGGGLTGNYVHDNVIAHQDNPSDPYNNFALTWLEDWSGVLFASGSNNRGERNSFWYATAESANRFGWGKSLYNRLGSFNATPGGKDGRYLSTAEKDQALGRLGIPLAPEAR